MSSTLAITTTRDCTWEAATSAGWVSLVPPTSGQGSGSVAYRVSPNADPSPRQATVDVNDLHVSLTQEAAPCRFGVSPASATVSADGGTVSVAVEIGRAHV